MITLIESIAREIVRRLERIQIVNDYTFDCCRVVRPDRLGDSWSPEDGLIVLKQNDSEPIPELTYPGNPPGLAFETEFEICCFVRDSDFKPEDQNIEQNERAGQIIKALTTETASPSTWYTFGGNAIVSELGLIKDFPAADGTHNGTTQTLKVTYRHPENDPYTARI